MSDKIHFEKQGDNVRLVLEIPGKWEQAIRQAVEMLDQSGDDEATARVLAALIGAAEQEYFWTPEWQAGEAEVDKALNEGRYKTFDSMDDMLTFLDDQ